MKFRYAFFVCLLFLTATAHAQDIGAGQGFLPYQPYDDTNIDSVNIQNGNLNVQIPLISFPQLGDLPDLTLSIVYHNFGWSDFSYCDDSGCYDWSEPNGWGAYVTWASPYVASDFAASSLLYTVDPIIVVTDATGAEHPMGFAGAPYGASGGYAEAIDGSGFRDINGYATAKNGIISTTSASVYALPDISDTHGNTIQMYKTSSTLGYTDSLGRTIPLPNSFNFVGDTGAGPFFAGCHSYSYPGPPGSSGGTVAIQYCYGSAGLTSVILPNGTWSLSYDTLGDLAQITTPAGGTISYDWTWGDWTPDFSPRTLVDRKVNANDGSGDKTWTYAVSYSGPITDTVTDPDLNETVHTFSVLIGAAQAYETQTKYYSGSTTLLKTVDMTYSPIAPSCFTTCGADYMAQATVTTTWPSGKVSETCIYYDHQVQSGSGTCPAATIGTSGVTFYNYYGSSWHTYNASYGSEVERDEHDYGSGSPLLRQTTTAWLWQSAGSYLGYNLLDRSSTITINDGSLSVATKTTYAYDESSRSSCSSSYPCGDLTTVNRYYSSSSYVTTHTNYNSYGMRTATIDANGNQTGYSYDSTNAFLSEIDYPTTGSGTTHTEQFQYDDAANGASATGGTGVLNWHKDQNGQETSYTYDPARRVTSVSYPGGGSESYTYDDSVSYPNSPNFTYTKAIATTPTTKNFVQEGVVDGLGRKIRTITTVDSSTCSGTVYIVTTYDSEGRIASVSNPECSPSGTDKIQYAYDPLNRVTTVTQQDGGTVQTSYTNYPCTTTTDEASKARKSCVDAAERITGVWEDPSSLNYETDYSYDANNNLTQVQQQGGDSNSSHWRTRTLAYDFLSRLHSASNPESSTTCYGTYSGSTCQWNGYDANGNLLYNTDARGITTTYTYDALNRLTQKSYSDSTPTVNYSYDGVSPTACTISSFSYGSYPKPRRTAMCDGPGSEAFSYDPMGRVLNDQRTTNGVTKTTSYTYNLDGTIYTLANPAGRTITYGINVAEQPTQVADDSSVTYAETALYMPWGALSSLTNVASTNILSSLYYNSRMQPCRIAVNSSGGSAPGSCTDSSIGNAMDFTYDFHLGSGDNGNVFKITNNRTSASDRNINYTYDALNRISAAYTDGSLWGESYSIDPWGNMYGIGTYSTWPAGESLSQTVDSSTNRFSSVCGGSCYDASGNLLNDGANTYTYDAEGRISVGAGVTYYYDGDGKRVRKSSGTLYWYGSGSDVLDETDGSGTLTNEYILFGGKRIARRDASNNIYYYFADHLGTSRAIVQSTSTSDCYDEDYYPYGREVPHGSETPAFVNTCTQNYKFTGKERDSESLLDNFGARYDSSQYGRFMTPDWSDETEPVPYADYEDPQTLNLYTYARNNPLTVEDPDGHDHCDGADSGDPHDCELQGGTWVLGNEPPPPKPHQTDDALSPEAIFILSRARDMATPGVNLAASGLKLFGNIVSFGMMTAAECVAGDPDCTKTSVALAALPMLGPLSEELGVSIRNLKHITKHLEEFTALDPSLNLRKVVDIGQDVTKSGIQVGPRAWEKTVQIGQETVTVKAYNNTNGVLRTVYVKK